MVLTNFEKATNQVSNDLGLIGRYKEKVQQHETTPLTSVRVSQLIKDVEKLKDRVDETHIELVNSAPQGTDLEPYKKDFYSHLDILDEIICDLETIMVSLRSEVGSKNPSHSTSSSHDPSHSAQLKLPKLELPTFSGDIADWLNFRDLFVAAVHDNEKLSDAQKLTYLRSSLSGDASKVIKSISSTNENYSVAWDLLKERFHNERELFFAVLQRFISQPSLSSDSASGLRSLVDTSKECIRSLEILKVPVQHWDGILIFLMSKKLDPTTRQFWELSLSDNSLPVMEEFLKFLETRGRALAASGVTRPRNQQSGHPGQNPQRPPAHNHHVRTQGPCKLCNAKHPIFQCPSFLAQSVEDRWTAIKKVKACFNCLQDNHACSQCPSSKSCKKCDVKHHTLLHREKETSSSTPALSHHSRKGQLPPRSPTQTILATALLSVINHKGITHSCRALLDGGSTSSFITDDCARKVGLRRTGTPGEVFGLSSASVGTIKGTVNATIKPHFPSMTAYQVEMLILNKITTKLPIHPCKQSKWTHLNGLNLADPKFHEPGEIDILIGADLFYNLLEEGKLTGPKDSPLAINSSLGWLIAGSSSSDPSPVIVHMAEVSLDTTLKRFWELESVPNVPVMTKEEELAEDHFKTTCKRDDVGRYVVSLPIKSPCPKLGSTREMALRRFTTLEKRLERQPQLYKDYRDFVQEYQTLGHMVEVPMDRHESKGQVAYIPHHCVLKESSATTKLRVVFDASAKSTTGVSLNDTLMVGPTIQRSLVSILTSFRIHPVAMTADIAKMFRQVSMDPSCQDLQRIFWRNNSHEPLQEFKLTTVTYGTASASFHATRVLQQLAEDERSSFPLGAQVLQEDLYMDDLMSGGPSDHDAILLQSQLIQLTRRGGFELRQWASNSPAILESLPPELRATQVPVPIDCEEVVKTLGLHWRPGSDEFTFNVTLTPPPPKFTKRVLLSEIARIFDPLGWLAPIIIRAKILLQLLWKLDLEWDDPLPVEVQRDWIQYRSSLPSIKNIHIPRLVMTSNPTMIHIVGFSDASEKAYSAVVYLKVEEGRRTQVSLITSKTRVAPTKTISLPRLELCGALLLAQLIPPTIASLRLQDAKVRVRAYTDSTVVLGWINSHPSRWKTFVANRVTQIQDLLPKAKWMHVRGEENPADCASRGIDPSELQHHPLWWTGPPWLSSMPYCEPPPPSGPDHDGLKDEERTRAVLGLHLRVDLQDSLLYKVSTLLKVMRTTAWVLRFAKLWKMKVSKIPFTDPFNPLTPSEIDNGLMHWIKVVQTNEFPREIRSLQHKKPLPDNSKLLPLNPFLDDNGFLRVGGRLRKSLVPNDQKYPYILPRHHRLTELLIIHIHEVNYHAGAQLVHSFIQRRFWVLRARDAIRHQILKCVNCTRHSATTTTNLMGDLPSIRVTPARPFLNSGVDYAGPFTMRPIPGRSKVTYKAYLCLFVCLSTRAIHLELASALSTEAFLAALRRFVARRGKPSQIWSDCGTNFVGAAREIKEFQALTNSNSHNQAMSDSLSSEGIHWHFNPAGAPHFGGLWEAGVKSVKFHLHRVAQGTRLTFEEMTTVLTQIEAILNSRPLTPISSDPTDLAALTPGHFLIGEPLTSIPDPDLTLEKENRLSRWQLIQKMQQHFWHRWSNEFLSRLQQRPKWMKVRENLKVGDLVLIKEDNLPPLNWKMGRILSTHPGKDGMTRVVTLKTQDSELTRPITKLCLLPLDKSE